MAKISYDGTYTSTKCFCTDDEQNKRGYPSKEYLELYKRWGEGEIGIIVFG